MSEKWSCPTCGLHFEDEFEDTLKPECALWKVYNAETLETEDKKKVWDWWFSAPGNYLASKYNLYLMIQFAGFKPVVKGGEHGNQFAENVRGWEKMNDAQQRDFQREWQKWCIELQRVDGVWTHLVQEFARIYRLRKFIETLPMGKKAVKHAAKVIKKKQTKKGNKK